MTFHWEHPGWRSDLGQLSVSSLFDGFGVHRRAHPLACGLVCRLQVYAWGILALLGSAQVGAAVI